MTTFNAWDLGDKTRTYLIVADRPLPLPAYSWPLSDATGIDIRRINSHVAKSLSAFWFEIAAALQFPEHFGRNLNALYDCISDMGWLQSHRICIVARDANTLLQHETDEVYRSVIATTDRAARDLAEGTDYEKDIR